MARLQNVFGDVNENSALVWPNFACFSPSRHRMAPPTVLVTGGAGYIGSHTVLEMLNAGYNVICVDNLCNAYSSGAKLPEALSRVQEITGKKVNFYRVDITDREQVRSVFQEVS